jgi:hypothetical protein
MKPLFISKKILVLRNLIANSNYVALNRRKMFMQKGDIYDGIFVVVVDFVF